MLHGGSSQNHTLFKGLFLCAILAIVLCLPLAASVAVPNSNCYAFDNSSHLFDFTHWIGHPFEYDDAKEGDLVVRFCKDAERRSQMGYVDLGRYAASHYFVAGPGSVDFIQGFNNGDLTNCEYSYDKMGRTTQINIICGGCLNGGCKGPLGCICRVSYDKETCRTTIELAIPCVKCGPRVFEGFTVGFHPRSWEIVYNGMTQVGFEKPEPHFCFGVEQTSVSLYLTAKSSLSALVGKPVFKVNPDEGLEVKLSGSGISGNKPTTLSPSVLIVHWRCEKAREAPYAINISTPVDGYDPVEFTLSKLCGYKQAQEDDSMRGWTTFGVISCIFIILSTVSCCGGFIYNFLVLLVAFFICNAIGGVVGLQAALMKPQICKGKFFFNAVATPEPVKNNLADVFLNLVLLMCFWSSFATQVAHCLKNCFQKYSAQFWLLGDEVVFLSSGPNADDWKLKGRSSSCDESKSLPWSFWI